MAVQASAKLTPRVQNLGQLGRAAAILSVISGCAPMPAVLEPIEGPKLDRLESAYDRAKWRWVRNPDGRALLTHTEVEKCFVDPEPPPDTYDPGFIVKRGEKTIGGARYEVVSVFEKHDFWEAVYTRSGSSKPILSVYARGRCQDEAERILQRYEASRPTAATGATKKTEEKK
jgi:hypothetical protein